MPGESYACLHGHAIDAVDRTSYTCLHGHALDAGDRATNVYMAIQWMHETDLRMFTWPSNRCRRQSYACLHGLAMDAEDRVHILKLNLVSFHMHFM